MSIIKSIIAKIANMFGLSVIQTDKSESDYSNTDYNTPKEFEDNLKGRCDLVIKIRDYRVVNYTKNL